MPNWLIVYLVACGFVFIIIIVVLFYTGMVEGFDKFPLFDIFPPLLKKHIKVNWFGATLLYLLITALVPAIGVISLLYWLSIVGIK